MKYTNVIFNTQATKAHSRKKDILNGLISNKETEFVILKYSHKEKWAAPNGFTCKIYQTFRKKIIKFYKNSP